MEKQRVTLVWKIFTRESMCVYFELNMPILPIGSHIIIQGIKAKIETYYWNGYETVCQVSANQNKDDLVKSWGWKEGGVDENWNVIPK